MKRIEEYNEAAWPGSGARGQDLIAPGKSGRLLEHRGHGTVFVFAELDGALDGGVIELAAQAIKNIKVGPDRGRLLGALAGTDDFERLQLLPFLFENGHDVRGRTGWWPQIFVRQSISPMQSACKLLLGRIAGGAARHEGTSRFAPDWLYD